ncbi:MAG TPA: GGDEF domain-containing protein [Solirubrobacterales bacterium]|nr:GGDEF domain-containing protein [Solirubrobacterales bacterium]
MHADLLQSLHEEIGTNGEHFAQAAQRLAAEFGSVTAAAVEAAQGSGGRQGGARRSNSGEAPSGTPLPSVEGAVETLEQLEELPSLYQPGHMRRRLEQLLETNRRYGHPFGIAVFDAAGPDTRPGDGNGHETVLAIVGAALRDSIRIVDEAFRLEEDAICVLAPNLHTVEGVQMCERLLGQLDELERAGGMRISVSAGVVACPDHGADADELLHKADAAMWRARSLGQPVGVGALQDR